MGTTKNNNNNFNSTSKSDNSANDNKNNTRVVLNVYDLTPLNNYLYWFGFGIFHSGIEVHGKEYGFGAHDFPASGVFEVEPRKCPGFVYRCSVTLGQVNMHPSEFRTFIEGIANEYHGDTYHLISKNCNHFTDDMSHRLSGKRIPGWVNRLAKLEDEITECLSTASPCGSQSTSGLDDDQEKRLLSPLASKTDNDWGTRVDLRYISLPVSLALSLLGSRCVNCNALIVGVAAMFESFDVIARISITPVRLPTLLLLFLWSIA
ncbi:hypothetical protein JHK85_010493 [Glycine max]|nr:hypothetical protein JHK85_010493 [Glycine max]KAG5066484.1 hypothetical protein JHK86_010215 [Glycine max]